MANMWALTRDIDIMYDSVKDSGVRESFSTGAVRDTGEGKGRYDLLPVYAINRLAVHFENGAKKYADENWRKGIPLRRFLDSALRHLFKFLEGQRDEDHAAAAAWNILALIETEEMIRRGILPPELNNLPNWLAPDSEVVEANGFPSDDGSRMPEPVLEPVEAAIMATPAGQKIFGEDRPPHRGIETWPVETDGLLVADDLPFVIYDSVAFPGRHYRLNGNTVQIHFPLEDEGNGKWYDTHFDAKDFGKWIQNNTIAPVPADLDACGTTDGTPPIDHAAETARRFNAGEQYDFARDNGRPSGRIGTLVRDSITWLREH